MRIFKIYSFSNFQIYNTSLLTIVTMFVHHIPRTFQFSNWKFVPFDFLYPFCSVPTSWQLPICSLYLWVQFFLKDSTHKWHQEVYVFLGLTFHLANCSQGLSSGKESACQCRRCKKRRFNPWVGKMGDGMATHSSILGWRIPGTKERGGLWSTG